MTRFSRFGRPDLKKPKVALYLRRSKGEGGSTLEQLEALMKPIEEMEMNGEIQIVNRGVVGRDINKKRRGVDLTLEGDIWNEGEGASGFDVAGRPVLIHLNSLLRKGVYDGVIVISLDRLARNYGALARYAYDLWAEQDPPVFFHGITNGKTLGRTDANAPIEEAVVNTEMTWGGVTKQTEIKKAEAKRVGVNVTRGYLLGSRPEWLGKEYRGKTSKGVPYRAVYEVLRKGGDSRDFAIAGGKYDKTGRPERGFYRNWAGRLQGYADLGVLDTWLDGVDKVNAFIRSLSPTQPKSGYNQAARVLKATAGYFAYPAGVMLVDPKDNSQSFIQFPNPNEIDFEELMNTNDASTLEDFNVSVTEYDGGDLHLLQTQPRSKQKK